MRYQTMLKRYAAETKGNVKDRMMLIIKIKRDGTDIHEAAKSLGKSGSWGYKWYARYNQVGFKNLDDGLHTGRATQSIQGNHEEDQKECLQETYLDRQGDARLHLEEDGNEILHHTWICMT